jgi:hypothetical protein
MGAVGCSYYDGDEDDDSDNDVEMGKCSYF